MALCRAGGGSGFRHLWYFVLKINVPTSSTTTMGVVGFYIWDTHIGESNVTKGHPNDDVPHHHTVPEDHVPAKWTAIVVMAVAVVGMVLALIVVANATAH